MAKKQLKVIKSKVQSPRIKLTIELTKREWLELFIASQYIPIKSSHWYKQLEQIREICI